MEKIAARIKGDAISMKDQPASTMNRAILTAFQRGVPLVRRPWAAMAQTLGMTETEVLNAARDLFERGVARRFGAVFDSRRLGYAGTLCAVDAPDSDIERVATLFQPHPGVTHCYEREGRPNLWFTLTAPADRLDNELRKIGDMLKPYKLLNLPAVRRFKVEVVLDAVEDEEEGPVSRCAKRDRDGIMLLLCEVAKPLVTLRSQRRLPSLRSTSRYEARADVVAEDTPPTFSDRDKFLVRKIQGNLPLAEEPFRAIAQELQWDPDGLLRQLTSWKQKGILRRIGFILRHRVAGFMANGMCVWPVVEAEVVRAGQALAANPEVTHCYERPASPSFPFNLFAMIHARERGTAEDTFCRLSARAALTGGRMLISLREFKKSSPVFFIEGDDRGGKAPA